jgi:hypothetical protein
MPVGRALAILTGAVGLLVLGHLLLRLGQVDLAVVRVEAVARRYPQTSGSALAAAVRGELAREGLAADQTRVSVSRQRAAGGGAWRIDLVAGYRPRLLPWGPESWRWPPYAARGTVLVVRRRLGAS